MLAKLYAEFDYTPGTDLFYLIQLTKFNSFEMKQMLLLGGQVRSWVRIRVRATGS